MAKVSQYSVDVVIDGYVGMEELIAEALERFGITVFGVTYADDMTENYKEWFED